MQDAHLAETEQSLRPTLPEHQQGHDKISNSEEEKTSITMSIKKLDGGTTESHGETHRQRRHLQLRSGKLHNGKRVRAHGSPHHLRNGGDFGFLEGIPENRRVVLTGLPPRIHICEVQFVHKREMHTQRAWLKNCIVIFVREKKNLVIWCVPCLIHGCLTCLSPRALHLPHSLFLP